MGERIYKDLPLKEKYLSQVSEETIAFGIPMMLITELSTPSRSSWEEISPLESEEEEEDFDMDEFSDSITSTVDEFLERFSSEEKFSNTFCDG